MGADIGELDPATIVYALRIHDYLALPAFTFLFWDHILTFGDELRFLWFRRRTLSTWCFLFNRYTAFFGDIAVAWFTFNTIPEKVRRVPLLLRASADGNLLLQACKSVNLFRQLLLIFNQSLICVLLTIRIYALYGRASHLWRYLTASALALLGLSCWAISGHKGVPLPNAEGVSYWEFVRDVRRSSTFIVVKLKLMRAPCSGIHLAVPWEALFTYDVLIVVALLYKSLQTARRDQLSGKRDATLLGLLIRDGSVYFVVMATANLGNIMTFYLADDILRGCLSTLASSLSVTIMSRLMLNLHAVESRGIFSTIATVRLRSVVGEEDSECEEGGRGREGGWRSSPVVELDTLWTVDMERSAVWDR
ncbi:hypothetical protein MKEN_00644200 [Mycena kentingensis (nom. inval.)]|nr:hypothetical protein MKEN_00644200 [Mycena kentingensis (nom. inval.)]